MDAARVEHKVTSNGTGHPSHDDRCADDYGDAIETLLRAIGCDSSGTPGRWPGPQAGIRSSKARHVKMKQEPPPDSGL